MADSYALVKSGKLKLKHGKNKILKKHKKPKKDSTASPEEVSNEDQLRHGGWWNIDKFDDITGPVAIEMSPMQYVEALDNGLFRLGRKHDIGEGPDPEEILTAVRLNESHVALKSGYNKYLSVQADGKVAGRSDAIASREQWEPIFQEGKLALLGCNSCFLSAPEDGSKIFCLNKTAGEKEMVQIRSCAKVDDSKKKADEDSGKAKDVELNYVNNLAPDYLSELMKSYVPIRPLRSSGADLMVVRKKFQSFEDKRILVNPETRTAVKKAKYDGNLHEVLLDRREKMKSDKFCK